ncbi:hypothetical protein J6590_083879, partial [Homalodisca vitripennis]
EKRGGEADWKPDISSPGLHQIRLQSPLISKTSSLVRIFTQDLQTIEHILLTSATPQPHILLSCNLYKSHRSATPRNIKILPSRNAVAILQTLPQDLQALEHILLTSATPQPHILFSCNLYKSRRSAISRNLSSRDAP